LQDGTLIETFRFAELHHRESLEALQRRATLAISDYREQILANPNAIAIPDSALLEKRVRIALQGSRILGFWILLPGQSGSAELDGLFVEPELFGSGIGRALIQDAVAVANAEGISRIEVTANARAIGFYERLGFLGTGVVQTQFAPALRMNVTLPAKPAARDISTERLLLKRVDLRDFEECRKDADKFMKKWHVTPARDFEHWLQPPERDATVAIEWNAFWMIHRETQRFMGAFGCRKFPNSDGEVEVAYGIAPSFQNRGLATEAVRAAQDKLFERAEVPTIIATTLPQANASTRVLSKCGFVQSGTATDPDEGTVWKWSFPPPTTARTGADGESAK
jgi:RimJ/RimL family protein N-acetyltransferase